MHNYQKITENVYYIGDSDRRLSLFENVYPIPRGISYNSYLIKDKSNILLDLVDASVAHVFFENLSALLKDEKLDYVIINHMEPDHSATLAELIRHYPEVKICCGSQTKTLLQQFFPSVLDKQINVLQEGDFLVTGTHEFTLIAAPMVHWPEVTVCYEKSEKILFSADAFGTFGALNGKIFADQNNFETECLDDSRRYYTNIVGKYGPQVQNLLKKASELDIAFLCPLHGPIWRKNISWYVDKYQKWSSYTPEENGVLIVYGSPYGHTANAAEILANELASQGITNTALYDVSSTHFSYLVSESFKYSHIVFASVTYNMGTFVNMQTLLNILTEHNLQNRTIGFIENGSWAPNSKKVMKKTLESLKNITFLEESITIKSSVSEENFTQIQKLATSIINSMPKTEVAPHTSGEVDKKAMFELSAGLFVLTAKTSEKDNGCIIDTATQITSTPLLISIAVNKHDFTHDMIMESKEFNISVLPETTDLSVFKHFGFQSGRDVNKFENITIVRSKNGIAYCPEANSFISAKVKDVYDYGTHTLFIAEVTEAAILSAEPSITYKYYLDRVKK